MSRCKSCKCNRKCIITFLKENKLVLATLICVFLGGCLGLILREFDIHDDVKVWIKIWGELFLRMLKAIILPLIMSSLITGVSSMDLRSGGRLGLVTALYHPIINMLSIMIAVIFSFAIRPGIYWYYTERSKSNNDPYSISDGISNSSLSSNDSLPFNGNMQIKNTTDVGNKVNYSDIFADFLRNLVPDNIIRACLENCYTVREPVTVVGDNDTSSTKTVAHLVYRDGTNTMGVIIFSIAIGLAVAGAREQGQPFYNVVQSLSAVIFILLKVIFWYSPIGIASLVMSSVMEIQNMGAVMTAIGLYVLTFLLCSVVHMFALMPLVYFVIVRKNPYVFFFKYVASAVLAAFGPSSSAVGVPFLMKTVKEKQCIDQRTSDFFLPLAISVSRSGSAMFIMCALLFIMQTYNITIGLANLIVAVLLISLLAAAASVAPSSSIMILLSVASALNVNVGNRLAAIMAMEWIMDRVRTGNNVTSSGLGCVMVEKICMKDFYRQLQLNHKKEYGNDKLEDNSLVLNDVIA